MPSIMSMYVSGNTMASPRQTAIVGAELHQKHLVLDGRNVFLKVGFSHGLLPYPFSFRLVWLENGFVMQIWEVESQSSCLPPTFFEHAHGWLVVASTAAKPHLPSSIDRVAQVIPDSPWPVGTVSHATGQCTLHVLLVLCHKGLDLSGACTGRQAHAAPGAT